MKLLNRVLDLLYPPRCAFCHKLLYSGEDGVCPKCREQLPYTKSLAERPGLKNIDRCVSPLFYEKDVRDSLHRFKFSQRTGYAGIYAGFMVKCIDENDISCDSITWAPVSRKRLRSRGYDQSELLARAIASRLQLPCVRMLNKVRDTKAQSLLRDFRQRQENVKGAYRCSNPDAVKGKRVLLIDDIVTTGSTLTECASALKEAGAASVQALTVARKRD